MLLLTTTHNTHTTWSCLAACAHLSLRGSVQRSDRAVCKGVLVTSLCTLETICACVRVCVCLPACVRVCDSVCLCACVRVCALVGKELLPAFHILFFYLFIIIIFFVRAVCGGNEGPAYLQNLLKLSYMHVRNSIVHYPHNAKSSPPPGKLVSLSFRNMALSSYSPPPLLCACMSA